MTVEAIAKICHEANRAYCETLGDSTQRAWSEAEEWQRQSAIAGVEFALANPSAPASSQHDAWLKDKQKAGWNFGPVKDAAKREHPCMVPYDQLPLDQRLKDGLFLGIVRAFTGSVGNAV